MLLLPQADELESLRAEHQQLQQSTVDATELRLQISRMRDMVADLPALQEELQKLQAVQKATIEQSRMLQAKVGVHARACMCVWGWAHACTWRGRE